MSVKREVTCALPELQSEINGIDAPVLVGVIEEGAIMTDSGARLPFGKGTVWMMPKKTVPDDEDDQS